ncbi:hypothetical protein FRC03_010681 [Tulasnella sp. 419]|nr:hypothetical protein FRC03_010681 [Tulasnella sp. 419]
MDINKLVNNQHGRHAASDPALYATVSESRSHWSNQGRERGREHSRSDAGIYHHPTLPPFSAILEDTERRGRPAKDGYPSSTQSSPTELYTRHHSHPQNIPGQSFTHPSYNPAPAYSRHDGPYSSMSGSHSSSTVSSTPTRDSVSSGPSSGDRNNSGSDDADDYEDESESEYDETSTPLPPYPNSQTQSPQDTGYPIAYITDAGSIPPAPQPLEDLRRHKILVHNDQDSREKVVNTWPCEICGQVLLSSHGYQGHMRRHYDERPFICEAQFCGKAFHDSATLARHRRTHSTEHKFECDFCGRRFKRKDNLNTHRKKHQVGGDAINPNLLRKPVTRLANGSDASPSPGPYMYTTDTSMSSPPYQQSAPPYAPPRGTEGNERSRSRGHSSPGYPPYTRDPESWMAPPYPQPSPQYSRMSTGAVVPAPRVGASYVKMEEDTDRGYGSHSRMNNMASPVKDRW